MRTLLAALVASAAAHDPSLPINEALGVPGFPDCVRLHPERQLSVADAAMDLNCTQRAAPPAAIRIGCVGDSITAGVHSSGGVHP